jgi:hypothetical protein
MRELDLKFQTYSCAEIMDGIEDEAKHLRRHRGMKWQYGLKQGPLTNFVLAWYLKQEPAEKERIAMEGKRLLEETLSKPTERREDPPSSVIKSKADGRGGSAKKLPNRHSYKPVSEDSGIITVK